MAAETVQIVLQGVDNATPAFTSVARSIKETGDQSQKLGGVFGKVFESLGMTQLSALTDQFSGLSAQMKELGDAGSKGGAGMLVAKAGIVAAVGTASFQVGTMIADWLYETEAWGKRMQQVLKDAEQAAAIVSKKNQDQFTLQMQIANAAATEEQRMAELRQIQAAKQLEVERAQIKLKNEQKDLEAALANDMFGYGKEDNAAAETAVKLAEERLSLLRDQAAEVGKALRGPTDNEQELQTRLQAQAENKKAIEDTRKANADAWAELSKQMDDEQKARDEQVKKDQSYIDGLKARNIELLNGKQAAEEFKAALAGVTEQTIAAGREMAIQNELLEAQKQLADEEKRQDEEAQKKLAQPTAPLQAMQSRLLSRVSTGGGDRVAKATEKTAELTAEIERLQREQLDLQKRRGVTELAIVEG
jgi:hypothetical protein